MKNLKRDKYLAEKIGYVISQKYGCYADFSYVPTMCVMDTKEYYNCRYAHEGFDKTKCENWKIIPLEIPDFSTWQGFGELWEYLVKGGLWDFLAWAKKKYNCGTTYLINPDRFADILYQYILEGGINE